ncbi:serine/threonine-protein kinase Nek1-like [Mercenaria mercenaria]|uniref:serine/threonine-protein kinase Nek1-like n=1 Tax=Mercenaria mercenaria TaxID=6596 RepID=UPI001E1DBDC1|nr:serine/threonine-protein kinase Nek1-like [Mercenaria mercenaria]
MSTSDEFVLERTLGEGAFGKVYLVKGQEDNKQYAMKIIDLRTSPEEEKELAVKEANLLKELNHNNVLRYTDSFESDGALCIVTEFCSNGDLSEFLEKRKGKKLEEDRLTEWFRQITCALQYLHRKTIIHRDVKTPNVFLSENWEVKLGDMGLAKVLERPNAKAVTFCGSPYYMSPEIFSCKPYDSKSDIWALGVIVYEMATLERPFDAMLMHQLVFKIVHGGLPNMPTGYKPELTELLKQIMQKDPESRPSADVILQHDYFKGVRPPVPPKPKADADGASEVPGKSAYGIVKPQPGKKGAHGAGGPFDTKKLLETMSKKREEKRKAEQAKGAVGGDETLKGIKTIIAKKDDGGKVGKIVDKFKKDVTIKPSSKTPPSKTDTQVSVSNVNLSVRSSTDDFETTLKNVQSQVATDAFNVMQLIVRTMTGIFPKDDDKTKEALARSHDPQAVMLRQIEHLQYYCIKVLNNDVALFQQAYGLMSIEKDENKLEEQLIGVLGHEKFGLCGVQLMFLKNFEYNLSKLQG